MLNQPRALLKFPTRLLKGVISLAVLVSFFSTYFAPELIHSAAHAVSGTVHAEHSDLAHAEQSPFQSAARLLALEKESCPFSTILNAHTSHGAFVSTTVLTAQALILSLTPCHFDFEFRARLARLNHQARGPPTNTFA